MPDPLSPEDARSIFSFLSPAARDLMEKLFTTGPAHEMSLAGRPAREELVGMDLACEVPTAWWSLTPNGLAVALHADVSDRADPWWHRKQGIAK
jgi:hypothetical protein